MNIIKRIRIENVKGRASLDLKFDNLTASYPNIIVAPNGFGKSTIAAAFESATNGKMKLDPRDIYQQDSNNHPKLEIELYGEHTATYTATDSTSNISSNITIGVINSPLYAKSTSRSFGQRTTATADLRIEDIVIYKRIPESKTINYSFSQFKSSMGSKGKLFLNISSMLTNLENISKLYGIKEQLNKCILQVGIKNKLQEFLDQCNISGPISEIKNSIQTNKIAELSENKNIDALFNCISEMDSKPENWQEIDIIFTAIQICKVIEKHYDNGENDILKVINTYFEYKRTRELIDERIREFNTTGRMIVTHEDHGKLIVRFDRAASMSNGERDVLSFVVNLSLFESQYTKKIGILIIDEVFDYLDGSNMLAVQYYLNQLITHSKTKGKVLFPIIFTHLDPSVFSNYYFSKKKIHYLVAPANIDLTSPVVKMLRLRDGGSITPAEKEEIEKYYIHFITQTHQLSGNLANRIDSNFSDNNVIFRQRLYDEITTQYLHNNSYDPIMVIAGLRVKIEELTYNLLTPDDANEFFTKHTVVAKLDYAKERGADIPELFYLLQPLYNDAMHLKGDDNIIISKIKSCYLKTDNLHIRKMISELFFG